MKISKKSDLSKTPLRSTRKLNLSGSELTEKIENEMCHMKMFLNKLYYDLKNVDYQLIVKFQHSLNLKDYQKLLEQNFLFKNKKRLKLVDLIQLNKKINIDNNFCKKEVKISGKNQQNDIIEGNKFDKYYKMSNLEKINGFIGDKSKNFDKQTNIEINILENIRAKEKEIEILISKSKEFQNTLQYIDSKINDTFKNQLNQENSEILLQNFELNKVNKQLEKLILSLKDENQCLLFEKENLNKNTKASTNKTLENNEGIQLNGIAEDLKTNAKRNSKIENEDYKNKIEIDEEFLESKIKDFENNIGAIKNKLHKIIDTLRQENDKRLQEKIILDSETRDNKNEIDLLNKQIRELNNNDLILKILSKELELLNKLDLEKDKKLVSIQKDTEINNNFIIILQKEINELNKRKIKNGEEIKNQKEFNQTQLNSLQREVEKLKEENSKFKENEKEINNHKNQFNQKKIKDMQKELEQELEVNSICKENVEKINHQYESSLNQLNDTQKDFELLKIKNSETNEKMIALIKENEILKNELKKLIEENSKIKKNNQEMKKQNKSRQNEINNMQRELELLKINNDNLDTEKNKLISNMQNKLIDSVDLLTNKDNIN